MIFEHPLSEYHDIRTFIIRIPWYPNDYYSDVLLAEQRFVAINGLNFLHTICAYFSVSDRTNFDCNQFSTKLTACDVAKSTKRERFNCEITKELEHVERVRKLTIIHRVRRSMNTDIKKNTILKTIYNNTDEM